MDAIECIRSRRSIRGFKPDPVPSALLREILDAALWSPSYKNSQPWNVIIVSGAKKDELSRLLVDELEKGNAPCPDMPEPGPWPAAEKARIDHLYSRRSELTGLDLRDPGVIMKAKIANFRFYKAPHVIYLYQDSSLSQWSIFDIGLFAQNIMLAAHARGVGTVPQAFATDYSGIVKKCLGIPDTCRLVLGMSAGFPDNESPANAFRTDRADIDDIVRWVE